jgi:hypothetical protein
MNRNSSYRHYGRIGTRGTIKKWEVEDFHQVDPTSRSAYKTEKMLPPISFIVASKKMSSPQNQNAGDNPQQPIVVDDGPPAPGDSAENPIVLEDDEPGDSPENPVIIN